MTKAFWDITTLKHSLKPEQSIFQVEANTMKDGKAKSKRNIASELNLIADQIINLVTIKGKTRFIDQDNNAEDIISFDESNKRITRFCFILAILLSISSLIFITLTFKAFETQDININFHKSEDKEGGLRIPHVLFMDSGGDGDMLVFKQVNQSYFEYAWNFKVPKQSGLSNKYFAFEDLGSIHVAYSNTKKDMTIIKSSAAKKNTLGQILNFIQN